MSNNRRPSRSAPGNLIPRLVIGGFFIGHGAQKQFGVLGGHGIQGTGAFFEQLGLKPGELNAQAAAGVEIVGGSLLLLGRFPLLAGAPLIATMITAARAAHLDKGLWVTDGGIEYPAVLAAAVMAVVGSLGGSGKALLALIGGAAGSTAVIEAGKRA